MTVKANYTNWRCPDCFEVVATLAQRNSIPCPRCRADMEPLAEPDDAMARAGTTSNGHTATGGRQ